MLLGEQLLDHEAVNIIITIFAKLSQPVQNQIVARALASSCLSQLR